MMIFPRVRISIELVPSQQVYMVYRIVVTEHKECEPPYFTNRITSQPSSCVRVVISESVVQQARSVVIILRAESIHGARGIVSLHARDFAERAVFEVRCQAARSVEVLCSVAVGVIEGEVGLGSLLRRIARGQQAPDAADALEALGEVEAPGEGGFCEAA